MSAWVVSKHHIDLLVSAAIDHGVSVELDHLAVPQVATERIAEALGVMLWAENIRSVVYRYRLSGTDEETQYRDELQRYRFCRYHGIRASAAAAALSCYDYQACDCPDYEGTTAARFVESLKSALGEHPDGSRAEPWGFDSAAQVSEAATAGAGAA